MIILLILSASLLTDLQTCPRRLLLNRSKKPRRWHPKALFDHVLRQAILKLSHGENPTSAAVEEFLSQCVNPGLDTSHDPYCLAQDFRSMLETILEALSRESLPVMQEGPRVIIGKWQCNFRALAPPQHGMECDLEDLPWQCLAFADDSGALHRWVTTDRLDDDFMSRECHSWYVQGDMCAAQVPMTLHVIEIGRHRNGHQHSPWCKTYKHPAIPNRFQFQSKDGHALQGDWKAVWYQDSNSNEPKTWVDLMEKDHVKLIHSRNLKQASVKRCAEFVAQVKQEAERIAALPSDFTELPIFRPACDSPYTCPWQWECYKPD